MITKKQWMEYLEDVRKFCYAHDVFIHDYKVEDVVNDEIIAMNRSRKEKAIFKFPLSITDQPGKRTPGYLRYVTKVKTPPHKILNTTLAGALRHE